MTEQTPMMQQYESIKKQYPDALLFYRMGDFYEMFGDDALIGAKELEIVLTARGAGNQGKVPMCGVPYHAAENYLARLIAKGYKVAICEQVEDPKLAKGIVKRDVIRVITPGTLVDNSMLQDTAANYLAAVVQNETGFGLAYTDISTGEFFVTEILGKCVYNRLFDEMVRISPAECLMSVAFYEGEFAQLRLPASGVKVLTPILPEDEDFLKQRGANLVQNHFKVASLAALGLDDMPLGTLAASFILHFIQATQKRELLYLSYPQIYTTDSYMLLDNNTRRNLELTSTLRTNQLKGSLLWVCDKTHTALGTRLLKKWLDKPLLDDVEINLRLAGVEELREEALLRRDLQEQLKGIYDLERLIGRIAYGNASPRDLVALKQSLAVLPELERLLASLGSRIFRELFDLLDPLEDICRLIEAAIVNEPPLSPKDGGLIKKGYDAEVDELSLLATAGKEWVLDLEAAEKTKTGIKSLKVGFNKVFGYYIEVTNTNLNLVPEHYIRKQTLANAERYITQELKEWENRILTASEKLISLEYNIFTKIRQDVALEAGRIQRTAACVAHLDVLQSLAQVSLDNGYCKPEVNTGDVISIVGGRHPVVEKSISRENYIANDVYLDNGENQFYLITGPNMAGKSTYMRQVALCVLMARIGSYIPAESAVIGKVDRIFLRVGASDDLASGQSTFMVEMIETANILHNATKNSLVVLDEIGRGTSTYDGLSIAWAVSEYLLQPKLAAKTLFATHYHELTRLADDYEQVKNYSVAVLEKDGKIVFLRRIVPGGTDKSYGIHVSQLAGLPQPVIERAMEILSRLEAMDNKKDSDFDKMKNITDMPELFTPSYDDIIAEIAGLDINNMSPLNALLFIEKWQGKLKK